MTTNMKVNGNLIIKMAMELKHGQMEVYMKVSGKMIIKLKAPSLGETNHTTKANSVETFSKVMAP
jgi:hypothetical protein